MNDHVTDQFSEACGATGPLVLDFQEQGRAGSARWAFPQPFLTIGRHADADLTLVHEQVARRHAYLQVVDGRVFCLDLESCSEMYAEGASLHSAWVERDQVIRIGTIGLRLRGGCREIGGTVEPATPPSPLSPEYAKRHPLPGAVLEFRAAGGRSLHWRMESVVALIGRSPACTVKLLHSRVSGFHCSLVRTPRGLWVVDLLSREGVILRGLRQRCAWIDDGGEFQIGPFTVRLRYDAPMGTLALPDLSPHQELVTSGPPRRPPVPAPSSLMGMGHPLGERISTPALGPLLLQVSKMQEQMHDQFKEVMSVMAETFSSMHRDHMDFVRAELEQIRRLTEEMRALRDRWEHPVPGLAARGAPDVSFSRARNALPRAPFDAPHRAESPAGQAPNGNGHGHDPAHHRPDVPPGGLPDEELGERPLRDPREVQALVSERLAAYERERQSCWNKIVRVVTSLRSDA